MHTRMKRSDILSAAERGYCLLCGGTNGQCNCLQPSVVLRPRTDRHQADAVDWHALDGLGRQSDKSRTQRANSISSQRSARRFFLCESCRAVNDFDLDADLGLCPCGVVLFHNFRPAVLPDRDYSDLLNVEDLPRSALRKPNIYR